MGDRQKLPRTYTIGYVVVGAFYTALFAWLDSPGIHFLKFDGVLAEPIAWLVFAIGFGYAILGSILNSWVTRRACERGSAESQLVFLSVAWVILPGSLGLIIYMLSGNPYMTIPFNILMLLSIPYYFWWLIRVVSKRNAISTEL